VRQLLQRQENIPQRLGSPPSRCSQCGDAGYVVANGKARQCECLLEKRVSSSLPPRYRNASLLDFPQRIQSVVLDWIATPGDGLLLTGAVGTGKTYLAAAITRTHVMIHHPVMFRKCADLYAAMREAYRLNLSESTVLETYLKPRMLALDDLGAGSLSDHERRVTLDVLDQRLEACLPTVVTTNWSLDQIAERMDDRIASRLSSFLTLELEGTDRRVRNAIPDARTEQRAGILLT
jgi:chromosomal replication initiation ATPase DnaA